MDIDKGSLQMKLIATEKSVQVLQDKLDAANDANFAAKEELSDKESELSKIRVMLEQSENAKSELRTRVQLTVTDNEQNIKAKNEANDKLGKCAYLMIL